MRDFFWVEGFFPGVEEEEGAELSNGLGFEERLVSVTAIKTDGAEDGMLGIGQLIVQGCRRGGGTRLVKDTVDEEGRSAVASGEDKI